MLRYLAGGFKANLQSSLSLLMWKLVMGLIEQFLSISAGRIQINIDIDREPQCPLEVTDFYTEI